MTNGPSRVYAMSGKTATFSVRPFEKLRKNLEQREAAAVPAPPCQKKKTEYTDEELFGREMNGVSELPEFRSLACLHRRREKTAPPARNDPDTEALAVLREITAGERPIHLPDTQEYVEWMNPACRGELLQSLHEGRFSIQAFVDLHGCTTPEAMDELDAFIRDSLKKSLRCVKVIHGRGLRSVKGARLKSAVVARLSGRFRKHVIAYVTAQQCDGGLGALYVLLGKSRRV
jgi:DNA-nicking Smr family endonuclease